jgi:hypothetical protein
MEAGTENGPVANEQLAFGMGVALSWLVREFA